MAMLVTKSVSLPIFYSRYDYSSIGMGQPRRDSLTDGLGLPVIYGVVAVQFVQDEDLSPLSELIHGCEQLVDGGHVLLYEGLASANRLIYLFIAATAMAITIGQLQG